LLLYTVTPPGPGETCFAYGCPGSVGALTGGPESAPAVALRPGSPDDVAGVVAFLASPEGAYVTGSTYFIDGGLIRHTEGL